MKHLKRYFSKHYLPRGLVLLFDMSVVFMSWFVAFLLRFNLDLSIMEANIDSMQITIIFPIFVFCFWRSKCYSGILRHSTIKDVTRIIAATLCAGTMFILISLVGRKMNAPSFTIMPYSVIIIFVLLVTTVLILSRLSAKILFQLLNNNNNNNNNNNGDTKRIMIFGAEKLGQTTYNALQTDSSENVRVVGFIDNNITLQNKCVYGIPIYSVQKAFKKLSQKIWCQK